MVICLAMSFMLSSCSSDKAVRNATDFTQNQVASETTDLMKIDQSEKTKFQKESETLQMENDENNLMSEYKYPVNMPDFNKYILLTDISESILQKEIQEYSELYADNGETHVFDYFETEYVNQADNTKSNCYIIRCPVNINFYNFHNLATWLNRFSSKAIMINLKDTNESYYCYSDDTNEWGDTLIGFFEDKRSLSIYCPDAFEESGNLLLGSKQPDAPGLSAFLDGYDMNIINSFDSFEYKTISYKM